MAYSGWLLKVGNYTVPMSFMKPETYSPYNKVADWGIYIYRSGRGENGQDLVIVNVTDSDKELCFARAQVQ